MDKRIGAQLYTVRESCQNEKDFEDTISKLHDIGYKVVQISAIGDIPAKRVKEICDKYNMTIACTHKSLSDYENKLDEMIKYHKELGTNIAGLGYLGIDDRKDKAQVLSLIEKLNEVNRKFNENGMSFAYHNHAFEFEKYDEKSMMDLFIEKGEFDFIVDVYWIAFAGINPAKYIKKLGKRCKIIHYKDLATNSANASEMAEIGNGNLDWDEIIAASNDAEFALVEQDVCKRPPIESMKISYDFLTKRGFE